MKGGHSLSAVVHLSSPLDLAQCLTQWAPSPCLICSCPMGWTHGLGGWGISMVWEIPDSQDPGRAPADNRELSFFCKLERSIYQA